MVKDRWHRFSKYRNVWVAREFVDWIVRHHSGVSRAQATQIGAQMVLDGLVRHCVDPGRAFADEGLFFCWVETKRCVCVCVCVYDYVFVLMWLAVLSRRLCA